MTLKEEKLFCCVCKKLNVYETVTDFSPSVQHDLDGRPHGEERYALTKSIQVCPYCRYANFSVDTEIEGFDAEKVVHSGEFLETAKKVSGAKKFILSAYLYEKARDFITAGYLYMNAAWTFDDENAKNSRTTSKLHEKSQGSNEETKNSHISARTFDDKIDKKRSSNASYTNEARTFDDKIDRERLKSIEVTNENQNLNEKHSQSVHSKDFKGENDEDCAKYFRIKAAECFAKGGFSEDTAAAHCDCLRRTGDFKAARTFAKKALKILRPEGELYDSLKIEIDLCRKKDDSCKVFVPRKKGFFGFFRGKKK